MCFTSIYRDWGQYCHNPSVNNKKSADYWEKGSAAQDEQKKSFITLI